MREYPRLLIADKNKAVYDIPLEAAGMKGGRYFRLEPSSLIRLPEDSELFVLPDRIPVGFDNINGKFTDIEYNPLSKKTEACYAVAAFVAPGFTSLYNAAYREKRGAGLLPLFSYTAPCLYKGKFYAAAVRVESEKRQELKGMDMEKVKENTVLYRKIFGRNRMLEQIETCALRYGCPAAKNFFLKRYEGPLPVSSSCNSLCLGCISDQPDGRCSPTQVRMDFSPKAEEIAEIALYHINNVKDPVVSFGQGCEGEPLTVGDRIEKAIKIIRAKTSKGIININTNGSKPDVLRKLLSAGLNSIRLSVNSVREEYYDRYYRPQGYVFGDCLESIKAVKEAGAFVSINYLTMPGFTDSKGEAAALYAFLEKMKIDMIQWRNLNYDPMDYFDKLKTDISPGDMIGIDTLIKEVKKRFPKVMRGYFNPSRGRMRRNGAFIK